jgi:hypothetical protein
MDTLKNFIDQNRDQFEDLTPPAGHEIRFAQKLGMEQKKRFTLSIRSVMKVAAISVLTLLSSLYIFDTLKPIPEQPLLTLSQINQEYAEVEFYYTSTANDQMAFIDNILQGDSPVEKELLMKELTSLDSLHVQLQKELNANPNDERVINTMLQYYRFRVTVLTQIIDRLQTLKTLKTQNYETTTM